jgi:hypothetical protein
MYSFNLSIIEKSTRAIIDNMDDKFEDLDDKLAEIDTKFQNIENLINASYKRVNDVYSIQNKANEIYKMNNQSINRQINQYDEDEDVLHKNAIFNSLETSISPNSKIDKLNNNCFIKHNQIKNQNKEIFYMSSNNNELNTKHELEPTETSKHQVIKETHSTTSISSKKSNLVDTLNNDFTKKQSIRIVKENISLDNHSSIGEYVNSNTKEQNDNLYNKSKSSIILEMDGENVKPFQVETSTQQFENVMKILNETNFIKNNSNSKLNEVNNESSETSYSSNSNNLNIADFGETLNFVELGKILKEHTNKKDKIIEINE